MTAVMKRRTALLTVLFFAAVSGIAKAPEHYGVQVVKEYPHDTGAYTQGLFFDGDQLYESTGQYRESSFRKVDLDTGKPLKSLKFADKYFAEGSVMLDGNLYILTWTNKVAFIYGASDLKYKKTYSYPREGWGLTTDGKSLIASDGSSKLYFLTGEFALERSIDVKMNGRPIRYLNELEWIDGKIWANVYMTDVIVIINPESGEVEGVVDCEGLLPEKLRRPSTDVLNGIACHDGRIFLTGKYWPRLYEVKLVSRKK